MRMILTPSLAETKRLSYIHFSCFENCFLAPRARQTVEWENYPYPVEMLSNLNPLDKGDFTGQELEESAEENPEWYSRLVADPFHTRLVTSILRNDLAMTKLIFAFSIILVDSLVANVMPT